MKATIEVEMDNAAFGEEGAGHAADELARILEALAGRLRNEDLPGPRECWRLMDLNGNSVGTIQVRGRRIA